MKKLTAIAALIIATTACTQNQESCSKQENTQTVDNVEYAYALKNNGGNPVCEIIEPRGTLDFVYKYIHTHQYKFELDITLEGSIELSDHFYAKKIGNPEESFMAWINKEACEKSLAELNSDNFPKVPELPSE